MTSMLLSALGNVLLFLVAIFGPIFLVFTIMRSHFVLFVLQRKKKKIFITLDDGIEYLVELFPPRKSYGLEAKLLRQAGIRGFRFWLRPPWRCIGYWQQREFLSYIQTGDTAKLDEVIRIHMTHDGNNALRSYNSRNQLVKQTTDFFKQH